MDIKMICDLIDERKEELFNLLSELIQINSENFGTHGNEKECAEFICKLCDKIGLEYEMYSPLALDGFSNHPDYLDGRNLENRYNVTARLKGEQNKDGLMLMGHLDTVAIGDIDNWEKDPLSGAIEDGKIFGRGACDDKYAIATALFIMKLLKENGFVPKKNLLFSAFCDEELGGSHGAMAAVMKYPSESIVCLDCRENQIWHCASGGQVVIYRYRVNDTVDSAERTAKAFPIVMGELEKFKKNRVEELSNNRFYKNTIIPETSLRYNEIRAGQNGADMDVGELMFTFYTDKTKEEIYEEFKELEVSIAEKLAPLGITGIGFVPYTRFFHYGFCEPDSKNILAMLEAAKEAVGKHIEVCGSCLSDLSVVLKYGSNEAYAFGAGRDFSLPGGAHQPNEYIECDKFLEFTKIVAAYVLKVLK